MGVVGLMNIQYAIYKDQVYILEANPRASRTVPLVSKVCAIPMPRLAVQAILGKSLDIPASLQQTIPYFGVKEAVFPFNMFPEVDPVLGPEMRSTGEVLGLASSYGLAFYRAQEATGTSLPLTGTVLMTVAEADKSQILATARIFAASGFKLLATSGTAAFLQQHGVDVVSVQKMHEGRPNIADLLKNGEIHLVINTPIGKQSLHDDSYIRKTAIRYKVPYITTAAAAQAAALGIAERIQGRELIKSLQEYHVKL